MDIPHEISVPFVLLGIVLLSGLRFSHAQTAADNTAPPYKNPAASVDARTEDLLGRLTVEEKIKLLGGTRFFYTQAIERLDIPSFLMSDGPQGIRLGGASTAYTAALALAASWDTELARKVGVSYGRDARARGVNYLLAPGMNLYRAPMNGRNFEYYGEDPLLAGQTAAAFVQGVQSQGVAATVKHFVANNQEFQRHNLSSDMDERTLRELYLRGFQIAIREGQPKCVMDAYNPVNGVHATENSWLNNDVLKGEWGFKGLLMSDWEACYHPEGMANGGLDLEMPSGKYFNEAKLKPLLDAGKVSLATIDEKVRRQLRVAFELGWFDRAQKDASIPKDDPASVQANREEAAGGITLLKNEGNLLPLDGTKIKSVVVLGPNAFPPTAGGGSGYVTYVHALGAVAGIEKAAPDPHKVIPLIWESEQNVPTNGEEGIAMVRQADAVVICVGFNDPGCWEADHGSSNEREEQDRRYSLPPDQDKLIARVAKVNPHTIVVLNAGGSVATASWIDHAAALVHAYYPGTAGNLALGDILFGAVNPSGKLPFSWEKRWEDNAAYGNYPDKEHPTANTYKEGVFLGYRWFDAKNREPLFPFGHGLSYTQFELTGLQAARATDEIGFTVQVRNTGARAGAEVVQVYAALPAGELPRPPRELKAYAKVFLQPGETKTVLLKVKTADLQTWDPASKKWTLIPGEYVFQAGNSSRELPLKASLTFEQCSKPLRKNLFQRQAKSRQHADRRRVRRRFSA